MPTVRTFRCADDSCPTTFDLLTWKNGLELALDHDDENFLGCPACGNENKVRHFGSANVAINMHGKGQVGMRYPYYDRGLGQTIRSPEHRAEVCKRMGVVPLEGNQDIERFGQQQRDQAEAERQAAKEIDDRYEDHPAYREYREMRDKGAYTDHLPTGEREKVYKQLTKNRRR